MINCPGRDERSAQIVKQPLGSAAVLALLSAVCVHAQELLTTDEGISLRGTVRLLQANAATCNAIAENEQGNYEAMRVNQDQPLHLWELEFSVFNGSGRSVPPLPHGWLPRRTSCRRHQELDCPAPVYPPAHSIPHTRVHVP